MEKLKDFLRATLEMAEGCADVRTIAQFKAQAFGAVSFFIMSVWSDKPELEAAATKLWEEEYAPAFDRYIMK
jgi:hypothetical protein